MIKKCRFYQYFLMFYRGIEKCEKSVKLYDRVVLPFVVCVGWSCVTAIRAF